MAPLADRGAGAGARLEDDGGEAAGLGVRGGGEADGAGSDDDEWVLGRDGGHERRPH